MIIIAHVKRFFHCLTGMFTGHHMESAWFRRVDKAGEPYGKKWWILGCICGKVFWYGKPPEVKE